MIGRFSGADKKIRTSTILLPHGPEPCASANSAISAYRCPFLSATWIIITIIRHYFKGFFIKVRARHKPGSVSDNHLSRPAVSDRFKRPTSRAMTGSHLAEAKSPFWSCSGWGLPEEHVTMPLCELLPHNFNLTTAEPFGGMLSVALSL